jgi:phospholipid/cholesterol/gamma-HCH transport system substrate-binding protein
VKHLSAAVKVGILVIAMALGAYAVWKVIGERPSGGQNFEVWAKLRDAAGLPLGSRVVIAGLAVGEIARLNIEGSYARVTMRIRDDIPLYDNAILFKKSSSLLGDFYLEIDPGLERTTDARGAGVVHERLKDGDEIKYVVEATSVDQLVRRIDETLPRVNEAVVEFRDLAQDLRGLVNGEVKSIAKNIDALVQRESQTVSDILDRLDKALAQVQQIAGDIRRQTREGGKVDDILDNLDHASAEARELMTTARGEVEQTGEKLREKLDMVDEVINRTGSVVTKIDEDRGTLGRLVNDPTIADNIEDITEDAKGFLGTLFGMQTYVGMRGEYTIFAGLGRYYLTLELWTRPDKFYYIELERDGRGDYPEVTLDYDPDIGRFRQNVTIRDKFRFTFQFAKRIDWLTLRYGVKESTGGIGADASWFDDKLKISVDVFDATFDQLPRLKVAAAYELFGFLYVLAGVDEILNSPDELLIEPVVGATESGDDVPIQFQEFRFGRDVFVGAMIQFNDLDLAALLTVGGAALAGAID